MSVISKLLAADSFLVINKHIAKIYGLDGAAVIAQLVSMQEYYTSENELIEGMFFCTVEKMEKETTLKKDKQSRVLKQLEKDGIIQKKMLGLPAKRYMKINYDAIELVISNKESQNTKADDTNEKTSINSEKPQYNQLSQKPPARGSKNRQQEEAKTASINKESINKNDLKSINQEVYKISTGILNYIQQTGLIDRLKIIEDCFSIFEKENGFSESLFMQALSKTAENNPKNFKAYLRKVLKEDCETAHNKPNTRKDIGVPEHIQQQIELQKQDQVEESEIPSEELLAKQARIAEMLRQMGENTKVGD